MLCHGKNVTIFAFLVSHKKINKMQARETKQDGERLHQAFMGFLKKSNDERLFNFALKLSGSSFLTLIETLVSARYYATRPLARPLATEFKNAKKYLEEAIPDCGSFTRGVFKFLTGINLNNKQLPHKITTELQTLVREKQNFPYVIAISIHGHKYTILVTHYSKDKNPLGYIYQTNTAQDMGGDKFSIHHWMKSKKNTVIDVIDHLSKIDILLDPTQSHEQKKEIYETLYTIPISDEVITLKNLDKLAIIPEDLSFITWNIANVADDVMEKLATLYQKSIEEVDQLKILFNISLDEDFVNVFCEKLDKKQIVLVEEPDLAEKLSRLESSSHNQSLTF